jgi:hypothetical protein
VKTGCNVAESSKEGYGLKRGCFANDDIMMMVNNDKEIKCERERLPSMEEMCILVLMKRWVKLLASVDIPTRAPWIAQSEQHFVAGEIPRELDAQMEGH